jgi:polysaccharide export outer membrane protein
MPTWVARAGVGLFCSCSLVLLGQAPDPGMEIAVANLPAQKIGINDLLAVSVYSAPELTRTVRVGAQGQIRLPMIKRSIAAAGLLPAELETTIAEAIRIEQILVDPVVTVTVAEYRSRPINIAGAVKRPLTFQALGGVTLLDALTRAEGLSPEAGPEILVTQNSLSSSGAAQSVTRHIAAKALMDNADPELNVRLTGGEEIRVPEAGKIYVFGSIKHPGAISMKDATDTTVLKVLALSEGLAPFAAKQGYIYRRRPGAKSKEEILVPLNEIIRRKSPDVTLAADDILYIPDAKGRRLSITALEKIAGFGAATTSGLLIWRR